MELVTIGYLTSLGIGVAANAITEFCKYLATRKLSKDDFKKRLLQEFPQDLDAGQADRIAATACGSVNSGHDVTIENSNKSWGVAGSVGTVQTMENSPGGFQVAGNVNVDVSRRLSPSAAASLVAALRSRPPRQVTVGALGMGGDITRLADEILQLAKLAGCQTAGVNHGVGLDGFEGVRVLAATVDTPVEATQAMAGALAASGIASQKALDPGQPPGTLYVFVGHRPG
jgi:hypothetical protein